MNNEAMFLVPSRAGALSVARDSDGDLKICVDGQTIMWVRWSEVPKLAAEIQMLLSRGA